MQKLSCPSPSDQSLAHCPSSFYYFNRLCVTVNLSLLGPPSTVYPGLSLSCPRKGVTDCVIGAGRRTYSWSTQPSDSLGSR
jgi:hypothetical protein